MKVRAQRGGLEIPSDTVPTMPRLGAPTNSSSHTYERSDAALSPAPARTLAKIYIPKLEARAQRVLNTQPTASAKK